MSRSVRKTKIMGIAICASEKSDKKIWHRSFRRAAHQSDDFGESISFRQFSDPWRMGKDGKGHWPQMQACDLRK